jgi:hypothetical protein
LTLIGQLAVVSGAVVGAELLLAYYESSAVGISLQAGAVPENAINCWAFAGFLASEEDLESILRPDWIPSVRRYRAQKRSSLGSNFVKEKSLQGFRLGIAWSAHRWLRERSLDQQ